MLPKNCGEIRMCATQKRLFCGCIEVMLTLHFKSIQFQQYPFGNGRDKLLGCRLLPDRFARDAEKVYTKSFGTALPASVYDSSDIALHSRCGCVVGMGNLAIYLFLKGSKGAVLNAIDDSIPQQAEAIITGLDVSVN